MGALDGAVCVVTGASRGVGKGVALGLGEAGATVYVTGRTVSEGQAPLPGTIGETAAAVDERGGRGIAVRCDHSDDEQIAALFARVRSEQGRLDVLVNNVFKIPSPPVWGGGFWDHPVSVWDDMVGVGLRAHYSVRTMPGQSDTAATPCGRSSCAMSAASRSTPGGAMDLSGAESPIFTGRAVVALATDPKLLDKSGKVLIVADLAKEYGFSDETAS